MITVDNFCTGKARAWPPDGLVRRFPAGSPDSGLGCGGRERLLKFKVCRVAGARAEGCPVFSGLAFRRICCRWASRPMRSATVNPSEE
jgi:hypothetical protein